MKSIGIKKIICLLILLILKDTVSIKKLKDFGDFSVKDSSLTLNSGLDSLSSSKEDSFLSNTSTNSISSKERKEEEEESNEKNSWDDGFTFPDLKIVSKDIDPTSYEFGKIYVNVKSMSEVQSIKKIDIGVGLPKIQQLGFTFELIDSGKVEDNKHNSFVNYRGGKKFIIPWRYFGQFTYRNPFGSNKIIEGAIRDDSGKEYSVTFKLPYKKIGWYINDEEGEKICKFIDRLAKNHVELIKLYKENINKYYAKIESYKNMKESIPVLKHNIDENMEKIKENQQNLEEIEKKIETHTKNIIPLRVKRGQLNTEIKEDEEAIKVIRQKIEDIKKKDPKREEKARKAMREDKDNLNKLFTSLGNVVQDRKNEVKDALDAAMYIKKQVLEENLKKIGPLELQNKQDRF